MSYSSQANDEHVTAAQFFLEISDTKSPLSKELLVVIEKIMPWERKY